MKKGNFGHKLKEKGLKATPQRILILGIISKYGHIGIEELYEKVREVVPSISIATIYKNLKIMGEKGLVKEVSISSFKTMYEVNVTPHIHIVCQKCKKILDLNVDENELKGYFARITNFDINDMSVTLFTLCEKCK